MKHIGVFKDFDLTTENIEKGVGKWSYLSHTLSRKDLEIATFERNYPGACFLFGTQDDVDYLFCSENYHGGVSVFDLTNGHKVRYDPVSLESEAQQYWCFAVMESHDPVAKTLSVSGCYWAAPFSTRVFDVSNPLNVPWPLISEVYEDDSIEEGDDE